MPKCSARGGKDASPPWENPSTGARGTVTPIADAYTQDGFTCRDFLASYVRDGSESWLQGDACRMPSGQVGQCGRMRPLEALLIASAVRAALQTRPHSPPH